MTPIHNYVADPFATRLMRIFAIVISVIAVLFVSVAPQGANDFWLQAKVGELIANDHYIPTTLLFPFTEIRSEHFNAHEWLPSVVFYFLIKLFSEDALPLVLGFGGLVLFSLTASLAYRRGGKNVGTALIFGLIAIGVENYRHTLRPELFSLFLLCIFLHLLENLKNRPTTATWLAIALTAITWANTHGSFILAPIISGIFSVGVWADKRRSANDSMQQSETSEVEFLALTVLIFLCTLINPFGWGLVEFVFSFSNSHLAKQSVIEWFPTFDPRMIHARGIQIGLACAALSSIVVVWRWRRLSAIDILLHLMFLTLALKTNRFLVYLGISAAYVLPTLLRWDRKHSQTLVKPLVLAACLGSTIIFLTAMYGNANSAFPHQEFGNTKFSQAMKQRLDDQSLKGNVINSYGLGAELVYRYYPRLKPSIDSRIDSYGDEYTLFHETLFTSDKLMHEFINRYDVKLMVLNYDNFDELKKLSVLKDGTWRLRLADERAILIQRVN